MSAKHLIPAEKEGVMRQFKRMVVAAAVSVITGIDLRLTCGRACRHPRRPPW